MGIVANFAYCAIDGEERKTRHRAKVVPCHLYQKLVESEAFDLREALRSLDFLDTAIVRTERFVAIIMHVKQLTLVGVRGTQFAYDWLINLRATKSSASSGQSFHSGFYLEAKKLAQLMEDHLKPEIPVYVGGHSLGAAVAAILSQDENLPQPKACYMYGSPRASNAPLLPSVQPFAHRRNLDVVPHCPPRGLDYSNFKDQRRFDGSVFQAADSIEFYFFLQWLATLALSSFPANHAMESYLHEIIETVSTHTEIAEHWRDRSKYWSDNVRRFGYPLALKEK